MEINHTNYSVNTSMCDPDGFHVMAIFYSGKEIFRQLASGSVALSWILVVTPEESLYTLCKDVAFVTKNKTYNIQ